jgi:hypothetical protein
MITHGTMDLVCTPVRDIFGVGIHNEPILVEMVADRQKILEMML